MNIGVLNIHQDFVPGEVLEGEAAHYAELGLRYLECHDYGPARTAFEESLERAVAEPELHYRLALALLGGRRPKRLTSSEIQEIERRLVQAARTRPAGHVLAFHAFVKQDFYVRNCLRLVPPTPAALLQQAGACGIPLTRWRELCEHTPIAEYLCETSLRPR
jgi:hypothetical protein